MTPPAELHRTPYGDFISQGQMSVQGWIGLAIWIMAEKVRAAVK